MKIAIASDHAGFTMKEEIKIFMEEWGYCYHDFGVFSRDPVDYPDIALPLAEEVASGIYNRGILVCGTGIGVSIAANKIPGIRAALCHDTFSARAAREHNDANVLTLGARVIGTGLALEVVKTFLSVEFTGGRHQRRLDKIRAIEEKYVRVSRQE